MSLLRTTQTSRTGTQRLSSYSQSKREHNAHPWDRRRSGLPVSPRRVPTSAGMPSSIDWVGGGTASISTPTASQYSTDDELNSIVRGAASTMLGTIGESRDPTEESVPPMSKGSSSGSSSFSVTRAFGVTRTRYESPTQRKESLSHSPRHGEHGIQPTQTERSRSPVKSVHIRKSAYHQKMVAPSISVDKIELQNSSVTSTSPSRSNTPSAQSRDRYRQAMANQGKRSSMVAAIENVSVPLDMGKETDRERATRLLSKVDVQKQASIKVQQAREAAKAAIEKARRARAEKEMKEEMERKLAPPVAFDVFVPNDLSSPREPSTFNDDLFELLGRKVAPQVASENFIPKNPSRPQKPSMFDDNLLVAPENFVPNNRSSPEKPSVFNDKLFVLLDDESVNLEGDKYAFIDDDDANKNSRGRPVDDVMDLGMGMLTPSKNLDEHFAHADWAKKGPVSEAQVKTDDCMFATGICDLFREELLLLSGEGDKVDATGQAEQPEAIAKSGKAAVPSLVSFEMNSPARKHIKAKSLTISKAEYAGDENESAKSLTISEAEYAGDENESDLVNARTWEISELSFSEVKKDPPASGQDAPGFRQDPPSCSETVDEMTGAFPVGLLDQFDEADESDDISPREERNPSGPAHIFNSFDDQDDDWTCKSDELDDKPKEETEKATRLKSTLPPFDVQDENSTNKTGNELNDMKFTADLLGREPKEKATRLEKVISPLDVQDDDSTNKTENELDDIMNFAAGLLGREPARKGKTPAPAPPDDKTKHVTKKATRLKRTLSPFDVQDENSTNKTENELDDMMKFTADLLGREPKGKATRLEKVIPPLDVQDDDSTNKTENELDDIMNFAAGLLGREPARKGKTPAPAPPVPKSNKAKVETYAKSDAKGYQRSKAVRQRESMIVPKPKNDGSCYQGCPEGCSVWSDDFLCPPEEEVVFVPKEEVVFVPTDNPVNVPKAIDSPHPTELGGKPPSLLAASMQAAVDDKANPLLMLHMQNAETDAKVPQKSNKNMVRQPFSSPKDRRSVPPPPEAFTFSPRSSKVFISNEIPSSPRSTASLADDLTEKSSPSVDFLNSSPQSGVIKQKSTDEKLTKAVASCNMNSALAEEKPTPMPSCTLKSIHDESVQSVEEKQQLVNSFESGSRRGCKTPTASEKLNKTSMTILDSDDEFWDTLSTIASTKDLSMNRVSHPHPHHESDAKNQALANSTKRGALGALLCNFWPTTNFITATKVEEDDHTLDSSEESLALEIPRYVAFAVMQPEVEQKEKCEGTTSPTTEAARALDNVETLITKESDGSSESSTSFDMPSKINSFHAEDQVHNLDDAIVRGQEMAATLCASKDDTSGAVMVKTIGTSRAETADMISPRYGRDEGDEPLGSPLSLSDDSRASPANPKPRPRKTVNQKHPWSKKGPVVIPKVKSKTQLKEEDSELAAMLGIAQTSAPSTDEGYTRENSDESDLLMVLTRSNGEDDSDECNLAQPQVQLQTVPDEMISSQLSGNVEVIVQPRSSAEEKFAATQLDSRVRPRAKELISSPSSSEGEDVALTQLDDDGKFDTAQLDGQLHTRVEKVVSSSPSGDIEIISSPNEVEHDLASSNIRNVIADLEEEVPDRHLLGIIGYLSATESQDDESEVIPNQVVPAPPDEATEIQSAKIEDRHINESEVIPNQVVPAPPDEATEIQSAKIEDRHMPPDEEMMQVGEESDIPPFLNDLLSKYDTIIRLLLDEKKASAGETDDSKDVEIALEALREQRERALGPSGPKTPSPLHRMQVSEPRERAAQKQSPIRRHERDSVSPPISPVHMQSPSNKSPPSARVQTNQKLREHDSLPSQKLREHDSLPRSPRTGEFTSHSRERGSPTRSPDRTPRQSNLHVYTFPTDVSVGWEQEQESRGSASPTRSSRRSTLASRSYDGDSITRPSLHELLSPLSWSPSRLSRRQELTSRREQLDKQKTGLSPVRSPSDRASWLQSRQETSPIRSPGRQERVSPARSPISQTSYRRARPRPEDMATRKKGSRNRSRTPVRTVEDRFHDRGVELAGSRTFERRSRAEMWEPEIVLDVMRRVHSPNRQRERLFVEGDDYAEKSRMVREQLNLARRASRSINVSHEYLFDELHEFRRKLAQHSTRMDGERRALVSESHGALNDFHSRLEHVRQMRANGRDTPDTVDAVERALEEAWEDFDNVRKVMLTNLKTLNDAKEDLMRERLHEEEESDEEQLRSLERMMFEIRDREYHKTEDALESIRDRRHVHGTGSGY